MHGSKFCHLNFDIVPFTLIVLTALNKTFNLALNFSPTHVVDIISYI